MNKKKKGKGTNGLQWYKKVYSFLAKNECYLTTPNFDETLRQNILDNIGATTRIRLKTEFKRFGLYVSRGKSGHSMVIIKDVLESYCITNNISLETLLSNNSIIPFTAKQFMEIRHKKNIDKEVRKQGDKQKIDIYRHYVLKDPLSTKEQKQRVLLDIWSDKKLDNNEIASTEFENILFNKLYGIYKKRVKRQQKLIIRNRVYFVDIYMKAYKVAIEVDGGYHNSPQQIEKDKQKDLDLSTLGLLVIRVKNEDVRKRFVFIKNILEKRHKDIIKGVKVSAGTMRI
jgi:very-short-patch-repair endonuclease